MWPYLEYLLWIRCLVLSASYLYKFVMYGHAGPSSTATQERVKVRQQLRNRSANQHFKLCSRIFQDISFFLSQAALGDLLTYLVHVVIVFYSRADLEAWYVYSSYFVKSINSLRENDFDASHQSCLLPIKSSWPYKPLSCNKHIVYLQDSQA